MEMIKIYDKIQMLHSDEFILMNEKCKKVEELIKEILYR